MAEEDKRVGVGFGVMVLKNGEVLLGRRNDDPEKASSLMHGEGTWTMPGGKMHFGETFEGACARETLEETGLMVEEKDLQLISIANGILPDVHFVTVGFLCDKFSGEPKTMEPEEITEWRWFTLDKLPEKVFPPSQEVLDHYASGKIY